MTVDGHDARRSVRVAARFLLAIEGIDAELVRRKGDVSATGVYFDVYEGIGEIGTVHFLRLASLDRARSLRIMAHVVRKASLRGTSNFTISGAALEFMPQSDASALEIEEFVRYIFTQSGVPQPRASVRLNAQAEGSTSATLVRQLSVRSMTIETNWAVVPGEQVRVEIAAPGLKRRVCLEGAAVRVAPKVSAGGAPPFEVEVEFQSEVVRPPRISSMAFAAVRPEAATAHPSEGDQNDDDVAKTLDDLFSAIIRPATTESRRPTQHLSGLISRIRLPTLCSLFEMEAASGELTLRRGEETVVVHVAGGRLIDVDPVPHGTTPRRALGALFAWEDGSFEFDMKPVEREDVIGVGTTALILDFAREVDEARGAAAGTKETS